MDLGDEYSHLCLLNAEGQVEEESRVRTTPEAMKRQFKKRSSCRIAIEAGTHSPWISRLLDECGHDVIVANPRKVRLIYQNDSKDDRVDAQYLARVARLDPTLLAPIEHRSEEAQKDLAVLRAREALVEARTKLVNHVRGSVKATGGRIPAMSTAAFAAKASKHVPEALLPALLPLLETMQELTKQIGRQDRRIERMAEERYPQSETLRTVPGVGSLTSMAYVLTLQDPGRFPQSRTVGAYVGLTPRRDQSGKGDPQLGITKAGDGYLRKLLVGSAHYILGPFGPDSDLRRWGLKLAERGGKNAKKRAIVAVARKLSVLLHRLWVTQKPYEPLRHSKGKPPGTASEPLGPPPPARCARVG
jgi:transposase